MLEFWGFFVLSFFLMEPVAWWLHKYIMHGPLWFIHLDHHIINPHKKLQKNDSFAIVFFFPSFLGILLGGRLQLPYLSGIGYGIMAYGIAYFYVHEVLIHKRFRLFKTPNSRYVHWVTKAHRRHHAVATQKGTSDFGMLFLNNFK